MVFGFTWDASAFAALMSAIATVFAAYATWRGPHSAAILAEQLRSKSDQENERRRLKLHVFSVIMQERATIYSLECVRVLNCIDFVFQDSPSVREAWSELYNIFQSGDMHPQLRQEKVRLLLKAMAADCGLSGTLRSDDFGRVYFPNALAQQEEVQTLQRERNLKMLQESSAPNIGIQEFAAKFPPAP